MKKHLSILMLMARSTLYPLLALLVLMAGACLLLFRWALNHALVAEEAGLGMAALETVLTRSHIIWPFAIGFLLITALLCATGCEYGSRQGYLLRRLSVSEGCVFLWQSGYYIFCYFLLWTVQVLVVLGLCALYMAETNPAFTSGQTVFLAFYRSNFLHSLLPLAQALRWVRNGVLVIALGIAAAYFSWRQRRGSIGTSTIAMAALTLVCFSRGIDSLGTDLFLILLSGMVSVVDVMKVLGRDRDEEA